MNNVLFFQTQQISDHTILFNELKQQKSFFSYFQVDQKYYLFVYAQQSLDINLLYQSVHVIQELDSKQRKIRSLRGFFLYALEIIESGKDYEILETNLQPFFWRKVRNIIRQNKKAALQEFLFGSQESIASTEIQNDLKDKIESLENRVNSLQDRIRDLETTRDNSKYPRKGTLEAPDDPKTIHKSDYTMEVKKGLYLPENGSEVRNPTSPRKGIESKILSETSTSPFTPLSESRQNLHSNQEKAQNRLNFITLRRIPEQEQIEIIQRGFQLQAEGKISLKKYYEGTETDSLFQLKGYNIKYESIRRTKLYQSLKE